MSNEPKSEAPEISSEDRDRRFLTACIATILSAHPAHVTEEELVRALTADSDDFAERDAVKRALRTLHEVGLIIYGDSGIVPSRGALLFDELAL